MQGIEAVEMKEPQLGTTAAVFGDRSIAWHGLIQAGDITRHDQLALCFRLSLRNGHWPCKVPRPAEPFSLAGNFTQQSIRFEARCASCDQRKWRAVLFNERDGGHFAMKSLTRDLGYFPFNVSFPSEVRSKVETCERINLC